MKKYEKPILIEEEIILEDIIATSYVTTDGNKETANGFFIAGGNK